MPVFCEGRFKKGCTEAHLVSVPYLWQSMGEQLCFIPPRWSNNQEFCQYKDTVTNGKYHSWKGKNDYSGCPYLRYLILWGKKIQIDAGTAYVGHAKVITHAEDERNGSAEKIILMYKLQLCVLSQFKMPPNGSSRRPSMLYNDHINCEFHIIEPNHFSVHTNLVSFTSIHCDNFTSKRIIDLSDKCLQNPILDHLC